MTFYASDFAVHCVVLMPCQNLLMHTDLQI